MMEIGKVYSFNTASKLYLGTSIRRAKLVSIMDADSARKFSPIDQLHAQIYPTLPRGTVNDANAYTYYAFKLENGSTTVLASNWIVENTIELVESINISIMISNATLGDVDRVRHALSAAGIQNFQVTHTA